MPLPQLAIPAPSDEDDRDDPPAVALTDVEVDAVRAMIAKYGVLRASRRLGSSRESIVRLVAGLIIRRGTVASVRAVLAREAGK